MLYVVSATYDAELNGVVLKLYNDQTERLEDWIDTSFKPYFYSARRAEEIDEIKGKWIGEDTVIRKDILRDRDVKLFKITMDDPFDVKLTHDLTDVWENHIKFYQCYIYDKEIAMGMPYERYEGQLVPLIVPKAESHIQEIFQKMIIDEESKPVFESWAKLLEYPAPNFRRISLDIEVYDDGGKVPDSEKSLLPILSICLVTNDGEKIALVLVQDKKDVSIPEGVTKTMLFSDEVLLLEETFKIMNDYPFVITFNGDDFDMRYIYNRAIRLGIKKENIPIIVSEKLCLLKRSVHIDLYKFFFIKAIRIYAFKGKYNNIDLDTIGLALLNKGKIKGMGGRVSELSYHDLIKYCMNDAEITLELTTFNENLVMNLILALERLSGMPIENVTRKSISSWIKSFMVNEHRKRNILVPNPEEIKEVKGETASHAAIKGKKYKGAIVVHPLAGTYFDVSVLDFQSLYPSIIKVYNLGYSTIRCSHPECQTNTKGELPHWICTKQKALESLLVGSLRDLRINWYKQRVKDKSLTKEEQMWYSVVEQSIKVILNASYGVFGADTFELYCPPLAEEVTAIARLLITSSMDKAKSLGLNVIYGDTDSIFIKDLKEDKMKELMSWTANEFGIEFEMDKKYRYVCMSNRKKNYLGVFENGEVDVKGMTGKKKHSPPLIKNTFDKTKEILSKINSPLEIEAGKINIISLLKSTYLTLKKRAWNDLSDLSFDMAIQKDIIAYTKSTPQHIKAAKMLLEKGYDVGAGSSIKFVKTRKMVKTKQGFRWEDDVAPIELAKKEDVHIEKYIEYLKSTFEQILDSMDIDFDESVLGLTKLSKYLT